MGGRLGLPTRLLLGLYGLANRAGLLRSRWFRRLFLRAYFFYKRRWEDPFHALTRRHPELFRGGHVLDVGANVGYTAVVFARALPDDLRVHAFEPEAENFSRLVETLSLCGVSDKVAAVHAAVGDEAGEVELWINETHHGDHRVVTTTLESRVASGACRQRVPMLRIDDYVESHGITGAIGFVKIDVQGFEERVLDGMSRTLETSPRAVVAFEYSPAEAERLGFDVGDTLSFFADREYALSIITRKGELRPAHPEELQRAAADRGWIDLLAQREDPR